MTTHHFLRQCNHPHSVNHPSTYYTFLGAIALLTLLILMHTCKTALACSSWALAGRHAPQGRTILHKNRDKASQQPQLVVRMARTHENEYDFLGTKSVADTFCNAGINSQGLAVAYNFSYDSGVVGGISTTHFVENILRNCARIGDENDPKGAYRYIVDNYWEVKNSGIILLADPDHVARIDFRPCSVVSGSCGVTAFSDTFSSETDAAVSATNHFMTMDPIYASENSEHRKKIIDTYFAANDHRRLSLIDCFSLSRHPSLCKYPSEGYTTVSAVTFAIDKKNPGRDSCMWVCLGAPDTSIYTPFHTSLLLRSDNGAGEFITPYREGINNKWSVWYEGEDTHRDEARIYTIADNIRKKNNAKGRFIPALRRAEYAQLFVEAKLREKGSPDFSYMDAYFGGMVYGWMHDILDRPFVAYELDIDQFPFDSLGNYLNSHYEAGSYEYYALTASDDYRWKTRDPGDYDESMFRFEWYVPDSPDTIAALEFVFEGASEDSGGEIEFWALEAGRDWRKEAAWTRIGSRHPINRYAEGDTIVKEVLARDIASYIDADGMIVWAVGLPSTGHSDSLYADFVTLRVVPVR